jgi:prepilin-type N-terminal cleavage/methylation domain-containing protein
MRNRRGFTLLEIMIVIAIVGIMAIIATTNFFSWQNHYSSVDFQREFLSMFNQARTRTMATNLQHRLLINNSSGTVVTLQSGTLDNVSSWTNVVQPIVGSRGAGIANVVWDPGTASMPLAFVFDPNGEVLVQTTPSSTTATSLTQADIHFSAASVADQATIRVFGWTSKARLFNGWS